MPLGHKRDLFDCLAGLFYGGLPRSDTRVALETAECRKWEGSDIADKPSVRGVVTLNRHRAESYSTSANVPYALLQSS